jgi:hypothetical protein
MEVFKVKYDSSEDGDLYAISIVDDPANKFEFIAMSDEKVEIKLASDKKKQILYGIVLRPEQKIYREFEDGTPFYLTFDAETIERFSQDFMNKGYQNNSTFNHNNSLKLSDSTVVEQWIVMDKTNDKGNVIGLPVENGDWVIGMKLSDLSWNEYVETGKAKGFSIDSFVKFEKINMKKISCKDCLIQDVELNSRENKIRKDMSLIQKLIKLFSEEEVSLASLDTNLGTFTADAFEIGNIVYSADLQPVLDAEFTADGKKYYTDETGAIKEIEEVSSEEVPTEEVNAEEVVMEDVDPAIADVVANVTEEIVAETEKQVEEVDVEALKQQVATLTAELEKLTKQQEEVLMENTQLKEMATSTKLKAEVKGSPITMKAKEASTDSTLSAIERITKKINK